MEETVRFLVVIFYVRFRVRVRLRW